jgi:hypothetical protein
MTKSIVRFINIIVAALLAGISLGIWIGSNPANFSTSTYIELQQNTIRSLNVLMISLVIFATVLTVISAFLQKSNKTVFITLLIAAAFFLMCILISRFGNQPINKIIMTSTTHSIPENLDALREKWWAFHKIRTITELIALSLVTWPSISKN